MAARLCEMRGSVLNWQEYRDGWYSGGFGMKVLVVGALGMLGQDLVPMLKSAGHEVVGGDRLVGPETLSLDITDLDQVRRVMGDVRPEAVINSAAYTNVDEAETEVDAAYRINALGSWNLALACQAFDVPLMYVSTDYVFDGSLGCAYDEYDVTNPQSVYGKSKRAGEIHVERLCPKHYIVRTAWLYGRAGKNFVETILRAGAERPELRVVNDQWGCPTATVELADAMCALLATDRYGTYHITGSGECTWMDFAIEILRQGGISTPVLPQTTEELGRPAPRPRYSVLTNRALSMAGIAPRKDWRLALQDYMAGRQPQVAANK